MPRKPKPPPAEPRKHERAWHEGSVTEVRPGRFRAFRPRVRNADGTSSRPSRTFASRDQAEQWAAGDVQPDVLLLGHWLDRWLALRLPTLRPHTQRNYRTAVSECAPLATVPLADVTTDDLQALVNELLRTQARSTVNAWRTTISSALKAAVPRYLPHNPMTGVRLPKAVDSAPKAWSADEVARLLVAARGRANEIWLWVALGTGVRSSEARALLWTDIDTTERTATVSKAVDRLTGVVGPTKNGRTRVIDLPDELIAVLVAHRARQRPQERYVCTSASLGRVPTYYALRSWLARLCEAAGVPPHGTHATRHTYATLALEAGVPLKEVSEALGHGNVAITANAYSHLLSQRRRRAATAIGAVLVPKSGPKGPKGSQIGTRQNA